MCKMQFVSLIRGKRTYKLYTEDINKVHFVQVKKRPQVPRFDDDVTEVGSPAVRRKKHKVIA